MKKTLLTIFALTLLTGCTGYSGPKHGYAGQVDTPLFDFSGVTTTYPVDELPLQATVDANGNRTDMVSTLKSRPDGSFEVTGPAVWLWGLRAVCSVSPEASVC